jgi:1-acyl-sn-glycerol-3-phosphate acyltransferase
MRPSLYRLIRRLWHVIAKAFAFFFFGLGCLVLALIFIPFMSALVHPNRRFRRAVRRVIHAAFAAFVLLMKILRLITVTVDFPERLSQARQCVICANHPSLIDVVILMALMPRADCIVKAGLWRNFFMMTIVRSIYIPNSLDAEHTLRACGRTLEEGNNLIIFPEGTRTDGDGEIAFQRNAAQIALRTGHPILPVRILADEPRGLRKGDSLFTAPAAGIVRFSIQVLPPLAPADYAGLPVPKASRLLTNEMKAAILGSSKTGPVR